MTKKIKLIKYSVDCEKYIEIKKPVLIIFGIKQITSKPIKWKLLLNFQKTVKCEICNISSILDHILLGIQFFLRSTCDTDIDTSSNSDTDIEPRPPPKYTRSSSMTTFSYRNSRPQSHHNIVMIQ